MALQILQLNGGTEWATDPELYLGDPSIYKEDIAKARRVIAELGFDEVVCFNTYEADGSGFLHETDGTQRAIAFYSCNEGEEPTPLYIPEYPSEVWENRWEGPALKVSDWSARLVWNSKWGDEELYCDITYEVKEDESL